MERLEERQLLAGAQLIGIQPNDGALLQQDDIRNVAPADLRFRFDQSQDIDPTSLGDSDVVGGIQITRANLDGTFAPATVSSNFGTGGAVEIQFSAVRLGEDQNGIKLTITKSDFGGPGLPGVSVIGRTINLNLNINSDNPTTALDLINALNNSIDASNLISAEITRGQGSVDIATTAAGNTSMTLTGANDIVVKPGYIGVAAEPATNEVIFRFAGQVPDDRYRIDIFGTGATPLKSMDNEPYRDGENTTLDFELDLAPQIVSVVPQPVLRQADGSLSQSRDKIVVYFNEDNLFVENDAFGRPTARSAENPIFYQLIHTADTLENTDDVVINPYSVEYSAEKNMAILSFASSTGTPMDLEDLVGPGVLRLRIGTDEIDLSKPNPMPAPPLTVTPNSKITGTYNGVEIEFLASGEKWGEALRVEVISSDHGDDSRPTIRVLDNVITVDLNTNVGTGNLNSPNTAQQMVDAINRHFNAGELMTASILSGAPATEIADGSYAPVTLLGLGSSFDTSTDMGIITDQNIIVRSTIDPQVYTLQLPGSNDDPGHRKSAEQHLPDDSANRDVSLGGSGLVEMGITRFEYNFRKDIGFLDDAQGNAQSAFNLISETQRRRAREVFQVLNDLTGVEFVETERDGLIIASGDSSAYNFVQPLAVLPVNLNDRFNDQWFRAALASVGGYLGLGNTSDLPGQAIGDVPGFAPNSDANLLFDNRLEPTILSDNDVTHLRQLYYPESKDIDMYRFELQETGTFTAETYAERQLQSSLLDTDLTLWVENADGTRTLISRNDNYFSQDSYIEMDLNPGVYFVGVSASGSGSYDPTVEDTGFGGTTQGEYDLRFNFQPNASNAIFDADNPNEPPTFIDGDGDGVPGGVFNFWFQTQTEDKTFYLDKMAPASGDGSIAAPYNNVKDALKPENRAPGDIVRVVGNAGLDGDWTTLDDNLSYQIGFNSLGQVLPDGATMDIPQGVTVVVDSGAIFQMRRARIGVGSSSPGIDRSGGAFQVLGTPILQVDSNGNGILDVDDDVLFDDDGNTAPGSVYFTSYNDESIGLDTNPFTTTPAAGEWGGILFRNDIDRSQGNFVYGDEGIFLNYVNHADIRYGGGNVLLNSVATVVNPIHVTDDRPTLTYNTIRKSADSAMSASPDSFEESNFHAPRDQRIPFTSDYVRVGPTIHHNTLIDNSINGLFVRVNTQAGSTAQKLTVSGTWDDRDIVHVMSENLAIASQPGGRIELQTPPPIVLVTRTAAVGGSLGWPGVTTSYTYKMTYVDRFGYESPASTAFGIDITSTDVSAGRQSVQLRQLPPAANGFVSRRLYRSENDGAYTLVAQLNKLDATFLDDGTKRGGILHVPPATGVTLTPQLEGTLPEGTYDYRITFVDSLGKESRASDATVSVDLDGNPTVDGVPGHGSILLDGLPTPEPSSDFVARRIYRRLDTLAGPIYVLAAEIDAASSTFTDDGTTDFTVVLDASIVLPRLNARLDVAPSTVVKLDGARFEIELGAQMIAEGDDGQEIIFTSIADDRYGAGGTFDAGNDGGTVSGTSNAPQAGDWGGIFAGPMSQLSIDNAVLAYGGGVTRIEGSFTAFNVIEIHEGSEARVASSVFEFNAGGQGGQSPDRIGRGFNEPAVIFVRQAQPVVFGNVFRNNPNEARGDNPVDPNNAVPAISINANALSHVLKQDTGRTTGGLDRVEGYRDNRGPLILGNRLDNNEINGMVVRGQTLTTQSVWDDTDIVHVLFDTIYVSDFHTFGGLTLLSSPTDSLVVKLLNDPTGPGTAGFEATGIPHETDDRIGGIIQIVGQPGSPVVLTSLRDDSHGAGTRPDGDPQNDTNSDDEATQPAPGDWDAVRLSEYSHDRNVELVNEFEPRDVNSPGINGSPDDAQLLGVLAPYEHGSDENRRLGFTVNGFLTDAKDLDVYSFKAIPGTEVWIDIDQTTQALDAVIEVLDGDGNLVARSDNSHRELQNPNNFLNPSARDADHLTSYELDADSLLAREARLMQKTPQMGAADLYTVNPKDPGLRLILPGNVDQQDPDRPLTYHVRVRSSSPDLSNLAGGLTAGAYRMQLRLQELDEIGGSTVRYATISYARTAVEIFGQPIHSPLTGEATEDAVQNETYANAQSLGNLLHADRGTISVSGVLDPFEDGNPLIPDVDFYQFDLNYLDLFGWEIYPFNPPFTPSFPTIFDIDYANGLDNRPNVSIHLFDNNGQLIYTSRDSNVAEDRPGSPGTSDLDDMLRGSVGATDSFLGVVDLPTMTSSYVVAVTADSRTPNQLDQFYLMTPTNPDVRVDPIPAIRRIAEDKVDRDGAGNLLPIYSTADAPQTPVLFGNNAAVPFHLGDVVLYVSRDGGIPGDRTATTLLTVDPFTGSLENILDQRIPNETGDLAMHENGRLYTYRLSKNDIVPLPNCYPQDAASGNFLEINPGDDPLDASDGSFVRLVNDDGVETYIMDPTDPTASILSHTCNVPPSQWGDGIEYNAITFLGAQDGFAVGERGQGDNPDILPGVEIFENILYHFVGDQRDANFGVPTSSPQNDRVDDDSIPETRYEGAGTQIRERGELLTSPRLEPLNATNPGPNANVLNSTAVLADGDTFTVVDGANAITFEFDTGPEVTQNIDPFSDVSIRDGNFFQLDDNILQLDVGGVFSINAIPSDHSIVSVNTTINNQFMTRSYEFDILPNVQGETALDPTATLIAFQRTTLDNIARLLADAINADFGAGTAHAAGTRVSIEGDFSLDIVPGSQGISIEGDRGAAPILQAVDGSQIADGDNFVIQNRAASGPTTQTFEFDSGYTILTPVRFQLQMPAAGGRGITDGESFVITNTATATDITFEFDRNGTTTVVAPDHILIGYQAVDSPDVMAAAVVNALTQPTLGGLANPALNLLLAPTNQGGGLVHLGSTISNTLDASTAPNVVQSGVAGGITDGEQFQINDGRGLVTFEMDEDNSGLSDPAFIRVPFTQADTADDIADSIVTAITNSVLIGLTPQNIGNGSVNIGGDIGRPVGTPFHTLNTGPAPNIGQTGVPGVTSGAIRVTFVNSVSTTPEDIVDAIVAAINDAQDPNNSLYNTTIQAFAGNAYTEGQSFTIWDNGVPVVFTYDNVRTALIPTPNPIAFDPGDPPGTQNGAPPTPAATMAQRIANAIRTNTSSVTVTTGIGNLVIVQQYPIELTTQDAEDRLVINGRNTSFVPGSSRISDLTNSTFGFTLIGDVEESYDVFSPDPAGRGAFAPPAPAGRNLTDHFIATRVAAVVAGMGDYQDPAYPESGAGGAFSRINFPNAQTADFRGVPVWTEVVTSAYGVSAGNERIPLRADDQPADHLVDRDLDGLADDRNNNGINGGTAPDSNNLPPRGDQAPGLANKMTYAINTAFAQTDAAVPVQANYRGAYVRLNRGRIDVPPGVGIDVEGSGPGGAITGLTTIEMVNGTSTMWAISDQGGLYQITNAFSSNATTTYIDTSENDLLGIDFSALTAGPPTVEGGMYREMLFATDTSGSLYAMNLRGELQPIFLNGATSVSTGNHFGQEIRGLAFSTLDENMFGVTPYNPGSTDGIYQYPTEMDLRLGLYTTPEQPNGPGPYIRVNYRQHDTGHERNTQPNGTQSWHFGQGRAFDLFGNYLGDRTYEFPGGAYGSMVSNEFSLKGYSAADRPAMYFSYFLDTQNDSSAPGNLPMQDAFRVFIADDDGQWRLAATNNDYRGPGFLDDELQDYRTFQVQETFDAADWRQARVPLDAYAGRDNIRIRIDFSSAADMNLGNINTTGFEIRAVSGALINDGDTTTIGGTTIEFDSGLTIVAPSGSAIAPGERMTIRDEADNTAVLQFVDDVLTLSNILVADGSALVDGDMFQLDDETDTKTFEFDTGYVLHVPTNGGAGINDQETFDVDLDGAGINPSVRFEFDKNGVPIDVDGIPGPDNTVINIVDNLTIVVPTQLGLNRVQDQDRFSLALGTATPLRFEFDINNVTIPGNQVINITPNMTLIMPTAGGGFGGVTDGDSFTIDPDGATGSQPPVVFEFFEEGSTRTPLGDEVIVFSHFTTQDVLADKVVTAVNNWMTTLDLTAKNVTGGRVVLDGTTPAHRLNTNNSPSVTNTTTVPSQTEVAERIIAALDAADGVDGTVLGLALPSINDVLLGRIVLGGTTAQHSLDTSGSFRLTQTTTPRSADEIADRIATAINSDFATTSLAAAALDGGLVNVLDITGGVDHTVDTTNAPGLSLVGTPDVRPGNIAIPFLPTHTIDEIIDGAPQIVPGQPAYYADDPTGHAYPGMVQVINHAGMDALATRRGFPDDDVIQLDGTAGNQVTFSPGVSALQPEGVIPIYVDNTQTANDVAERITQAINQAVARGDLVGVVPHRNGDLGYYSPGTAVVVTNLVNLEGVTEVTLSSGAASPIIVDGVYGLNDPQGAGGNLLAPFDRDMSRVDIADVLDDTLENLFHNPTIITDTGLNYADGDTFVLEDGVNAPVIFEFDSGYVLNIPIGGGMVSAGGISDGESFTLTDANGTTAATFEFDKDGVVGTDSLGRPHTRVPITENESALGVARQIVNAIQTHPSQAVLGLSPRVLTDNRVQLGGAVGTTLAISPGSVVTQEQGTPGVSPSLTVTLPQTLGMQLPDALTIHIPAASITDGETFIIDDGIIPPVTFEFEDVTFGDLVEPGNVMILFTPTSSDEEIGREIVNAINSAGLNVQVTMIGGVGNIDLGGGSNFQLPPAPTSPMLVTGPLSLQAPVAGGAVINDGDQFFIDDGPTRFTFEFDAGGGPSDPAFIAIPFDAADSQDVIADRVLMAIQTTAGLNLNPLKTSGPARVVLGASSNVTLDTAQTHLTQTGASGVLADGAVFVLSNGVKTVNFEFDMNGNNNAASGAAIIDISPGSTTHQISSEIIHEINREFPIPELIPAIESDRRVHIGGGANFQLDATTIASITQYGVGSAIPDGQTFLIAEGSNSVRFEYDKDGSFDSNNRIIVISDTDSTDTIAQKTVDAMSSGVSGLNIFPSYLGDGEIDLGGREVHVVILTSSLTQAGPLSLVVPEAGGGIAGVVDGDQFTVTDLVTMSDFVFEFDNNGVVTSGLPAEQVISFTSASTQNQIGHEVVSVVGDIAALGFAPIYQGAGLVDLGGDPANFALSFNTTVLTSTGVPGSQVPHVPVMFSPSGDFTANDVGQTIASSVNSALGLNIAASVGAAGTADQRRVELIHETGFPKDILFTPEAGVDLQRETTVDIIKQDADLLRIIGHNVQDPGPLGYADSLPGDVFGAYNGDERGQQNRYEGLYLDDFVIGFTERGERVRSAANNSSGFSNNPDSNPANRTAGEYQLEIRRGPEAVTPLATPNGARSMDTNAREAAGLTLVVQRGLDIADTQIFTVSDGVHQVVFEYVDTSIRNNQPEPGRIAVRFRPSDPDYVVAQRVRDAINGPDAQAVLDVTASIDDGTIQGAGSPTLSTSGQVNLFGSVTLQIHATDVDETNDTLADATKTGIAGIDSPSFLGSGVIGDNPNFPLNPGYDVDIFEVAIAAGETLRIDVDANEIGSPLDPVLRVFDAAGNPILFGSNGRNAPLGTFPYREYVDDLAAPDELDRLDPFMLFTPATSGTYYIGVSGYENLAYDSTQEGSGTAGNTGFYQIELTYGSSTGSDFVLYDVQGDSNTFRDQGQIVIHANTITHSSEFGIVADAGARASQTGDFNVTLPNDNPHPGPVRNTPKLNTEDLTPGVVISNNVLAYNETGAIYFSGDTNPIAQQVASVPYGRIINNTIYGGVEVPVGGGGTPVTYDGITFPSGDASFADAVVSYDPLFSGGPAPTIDTNPAGALGAPDGQVLTLGRGGQVVLEFTDNLLVPSGNALLDLHVFEAGPDFEDTLVEISVDGLTWIDVGSVGGGTSSIDIDSFPGVLPTDQFRYVRLTDDPDEGDTSGASVGADIDSVGAISTIVTSVQGGLGIQVGPNASPTILNNILADLATGIEIDVTSSTTVLGGSIYQGNSIDLNSGTPLTEDFPIYLSISDPLFRDAATGNFYLERFSRAIDSSIGSLLDRFDIEQVRNILGIANSPIIAPATDVTGQLRVDDPEVETPSGFGDNIFIDRGAIDRSDFVGPTATIVTPRDNDADGLDLNSATTVVELDASDYYASFRIRLSDGVPPADPNLGSGIDDNTVISSNVIVTQDGVTLVDGIDYSFSYNGTSDTIVLTPLSGIWQPNRTYVVQVNNTDHYRVVAKAGADLPDGFSYLVRDAAGNGATFEFESGYTIDVPKTLTLTVPQEGGSLGGIADGASFTVRRTMVGGAVETATFEFDSNGQVTDNNLDGIPDNFIIQFNVASTPEDIANAMVTQLLLADIELSPRHIGDGVVHLGSTAAHTVDNTRVPNLTLDGQPSGIEDGDSFTVDDGKQIITFEFDNDGQQVDRDMDGEIDNLGAVIITFAASQTNVELAQSITTAINLAKLGLNAVPIGDGGVHLGGTPFVHIVNVDDSQLVLEGEPGVRSAFGLKIPSVAGTPRLTDDGSGSPYITDGDTFTISDGTRLVKFEMDNADDPIGGGLTTAPNIVITYRETSTVDEIANVIVAAIQNAPLQNLAPVNAGNGVIRLGEPTDGTSQHFVDVSQTGLSQLGMSGVPAAVPVYVTPLELFDGTQVAVAIIRAINGSSLDVTAQPGGGDVVLIEDAVLVREVNPVFESNDRHLAVTDLAGNPLKPNLLSGETQTTIILGDVEMDFGDAPQTISGDYPTQIGRNGAIHMITDGGLFLGERIDMDPDGQISVGAIGDDMDSESFLVDTANSPGMSQSASQTPTVLQLDQPLALTIVGGLNLQDGAWFRSSNDGVTRTFEFYQDGSTRTPFGDVQIPFNSATTKEALAERVVNAVSDEFDLGLSPVDLGEGKIHLGGDSLSKGGNVLVSGTPNPFADGDTFRIEVPTVDGPVLYTFEFEDTGIDDGVVQGNIPVLFDGGTTQDGFVQSTMSAILGARLGIAVTDMGSGQIELNGDDEDGVLIGTFNPNTITQIEVTASAAGLLDAWIDFNIDGDFDDPGEQILASQQLDAGASVFDVTPPADTVIGTTIGRFRLSSMGGLKPTGLAMDGEVEDHVIEIRAGDPPVANNDNYNAPEDGVTNLGSVLGNDTVPSGVALDVASYQTVSELGATIVMSTNGNFSYNPGNADFIQALDDGETLQDTFTYRARDNNNFLSNLGTVTVTIQGSNDDPLAVDDTQVFTDQNKTININVIANDRDPEGHAMTIAKVNQTGTAIGNATIDTVLNVVHYDPAGMFNYLNTNEQATDTFTYEISDGNGGIGMATVVVTIYGLNDPPVANDDTYPDPIDARTDEKTPISVSVLDNDYDPEGTNLTITNVFLVGTKGEAQIDPTGTKVIYDPNDQFIPLAVGETATDTFIYEVEDEDGNSSLATVTITIDGVNDPPTANNDSGISVPRNGTVHINVLFNDTDPDGDLLTIDENLGLNGTLGIASVNADDTITYDPNGQFDFLRIGQTAQDRFTYTALDGNGGSSTATVTVTVFGASDPPVAVDDQATTTEDDSVTIGVLFNDTDDFGPKIVTEVQELPGNPLRGSIVINPENQPNNEVIYSPDSQFDYLKEGQQETEYFTYTVSDGIGSDMATVTVTINGVNDAPIANVDPNNYIAFRGNYLIAEDVGGTNTPGFPGDDGVLLNDTDAEMDALRAILVQGPLFAKPGGFTLNQDGTFRYLHNGGTSNVDTFQYRAVDEHGAMSQQIVTVVINIQDAPAAEWQNPINQYDVNNDGFVSPVDVLLVINYVNAHSGDLTLPPVRPVGAPFYDVNGDGDATGIDILSVITELNRLNGLGGAMGEGEGELFVQTPAWPSSWVVEPVNNSLANRPASWLDTSRTVTDETDEVPRTTARRLQSQATIKSSSQREEVESIHLDVHGLDDVLHSLALDVDKSRTRKLAVDQLMDEIFS